MELGRDALARGTCLISGPLLPASDFEITSNHYNCQCGVCVYGIPFKILDIYRKAWISRIALSTHPGKQSKRGHSMCELYYLTSNAELVSISDDRYTVYRRRR
jgi:hypothetical protein